MAPKKREWQEVFIAKLQKSPNVAAAARAAKVSRQAAYKHREENPAFAEAWDEALTISVEEAEGEMYRRAVHGTRKPVFHLGKKIGEIKEYSDTLLIFLLKAHKPEKYRETVRSELTGANGEAIQVNDISLTDQQRLSRIAELLNRAGTRRAGPASGE